VSETSNAEYIIELDGISKAFPGVQALDNVSLRIKKGTVHALVGENGAGKSTLIKIINGIYTCDSGEIIFNSEKVVPQNPKHMLDMGIATIHQELSPILEMTIAENIFLGREPLTKSNTLDWKKMLEDTQALMDEFGFRYNPKSKMKELSISDIQLIEVVKAISRGASLIIMDEPTSSITESETQILFKHIRRLKQQGVSIIYISHKMEEIFEICDEITIFRDGKWIKTCDISSIDKKTIIELMVGRELSNVYPKIEAEIGEPVLELKKLCKKGKFTDINFSIRKGEIVGFAGLVGAGRTELFRAVFGLDTYDSGEIIINGKTINIHNINDAIKNNIIMTPEDRKSEGLVLCRSIKENISLTKLKSFLNFGMINSRKELQKVNEMIDKLSVKLSSVNAPSGSLSGGNQQKVVLAKWLLSKPEVLILDEPTRGIDVGAKYEIYKLMCQLAKEGVAVIMISSELPEIMGMCDRVVVMSKGKITGELMKGEFSQAEIMTLAVKGFENDYEYSESFS
jgi:inositol transport system ATP-binding protein